MEKQRPVKRIQWGESSIILLNVFLFLLLTIGTDTFFSYNNLYSLIYGVSIQFFAIIGFTLLLIMGELDLSVGAVYGFSGTIVGALMRFFNVNFYVSVICAVVVCGLIGWLVGVLTTKLRLNSMMVTLAAMTIVQGLNSVLFNKMPASIYASVYRKFSKYEIGGIYWTILFMIVLIIILEILLKKTTTLKQLYYIGYNAQTARLYGCKVEKIKRICFSISAMTAALGGIVATSRITHSDINTGAGMEFTMITACVIGGCSMAGGRGGILKAGLGLFFLEMLSNGMVIFKIDPYMQQVATGAILVLAVLLDVQINRKKG
ncbi:MULTISPECIES: ABC transporter permease [Mediterraneibacter]|uniref:ABC transporter permease n=1 Tax=Mediterraneibacter TaxID=2316020 RepID=UPI00073EF329|nr:ABC transporter permease [Mediterraneibacter massiliensis]RGT75155.1 ABC transporter permease [Ruminococcus sp. AF18-22]